MLRRVGFIATCAFAICCPPIALAEDDGDAKKKDAKSSRQVVISAIEIDEDEDQDVNEENRVKTSGKITIEIDGEKHEFKIGNQNGDVVEEIHEVIKDGDHEVSIEASIFGHGLIVGPDGEKKQFNLGDPSASKEMLKRLPDEVRQQVEKAIKESSRGAIFGQGLMIGPDGARKIFKLGDSPHFRRAMENLPEEARKHVEQAMKEAHDLSIQSSGRAIVIGPDGVKKEYKFGDTDIDEIDVEIFDELPKTLLRRIQRNRQDRPAKAEESNDGLADKLDLILKRLDKIEDEIQTLKNAK